MQTTKGWVDTSHSPYARLRTLPMASIALDDGFWTKWQAVNHSASLKHGYHMLEQAGNLHNFRLAAGRETGEYRGRNFVDENVYKWLEAASLELGRRPDPELKQMIDDTIELIAAVQQPDGYINTYFLTVEPENRWTNLDHGHELYCSGHLFQAAVAHHRATGETTLLDVATRMADLMASIFGPGKRDGAPGHPEPELALIELYRETGTQRYLDLAKFFIDQRGQGKMRGLGWVGPEYHQDRVPIRDASVIEGHAVRAVYLMTGVTDLYLETGEQALFDALIRLWTDMTTGKLHVTGGAGARYEGEAFGDAYELPNDQCYCETCAAIGSVMWNWRLVLATGDVRYTDVMEQTLYNGFLSGPALDGTHFFYINPLLSRGNYKRAEWYEVACCPPNIMRTLASIEQYMATTGNGGLQLHLYHNATIKTAIEPGREVGLRLETDYPWQGQVKITIDRTDESPWALSLRIPGWCQGATISVNGTPLVPAQAGSYAEINRVWQAGDVVLLDLAMTPRLIEAHPFVDATRDCVAIQRGPVLYCLEQADHDANLMALQIDETQPMDARWQDGLLGGCVVVTAQGAALDVGAWQGATYRPVANTGALPHQPVTLTAVPYHLWGNRGPNAMRVWIPRAGSA